MQITNTNYKVYKVPVQRGAKKAVRSAQVNIFVIDRSGSMGWTIAQLIEDLIKHILSLPAGDIVVVYWFSSEGGQKGCIIKNAQLGSDRTYIVETLRRYASTVGATCFSEVLTDVATDLADLTHMPVSLMFFTDGYPVVYDRRREAQNAVAALAKIAPKLSKALFVGYGHYNRDLMVQMSQSAGGFLQHADDLRAMNEWLASTANIDQTPKQTTMVGIDDICFTIGQDGVSFVAVQDGKAYHATDMYVINTTTNEWSNVVDEAVMYGVAHVMDALGKGDVALEVLGQLGDVHFVDQLNNAFTVEDYGRLDNALNTAVVDPNQRYQKGKNTNYLPDPNAYCALDLLADLQNGDNHLVLDEFSYKRIGRKSVPDPTAPKFKRTPGQLVPFGDVVWNKALLNMSVRTRQTGTVTLPDPTAVEKLGLPLAVPTFVWRNYSLVANGKMNVDELPVTLDKPTWQILKEKGLVSGRYSGKRTYKLNLTTLPVINRAMADQTSAAELAKLQYKLLELKTQANVLGKLRNRYFPTAKVATEGLTDLYGAPAADYLAALGITDRGFSSSGKLADPTDVIEVKSLEIKPSGFSSLPKLEDVEQRMNEGKPLTGARAMMGAVFSDIERATANFTGVTLKDKYTTMLQTVNRQKAQVAAKIAAQKFAMLLTNQWFDEFSSRAENTWTHEGVKMTFVVKETTVKI